MAGVKGPRIHYRVGHATEPPKEPGYFWVKVPGYAPRVVEVFRGRNPEAFYMEGVDFTATRVPAEGLLWGTQKIGEPAE